MKKKTQFWQRLLNIISCSSFFPMDWSPSLRPIFRFGFLCNSLNNSLCSYSQFWILSLPLSWHFPIFVYRRQICLPSFKLQNNSSLALFLILHSPNQPHHQFPCYLTKLPGNWGSQGQNMNTSPAGCEASTAHRSSCFEKLILSGATGFINSFRKNTGWHPRS